jgi:hypothetical protein
MSPWNSDVHAAAIQRAARRFIADLAAEAILPVVARMEAVLCARAEASPFTVDEALARAWPTIEGACPRQEVIWATDGDGGGDHLRLSAFDAAGRMLLRRSYRAGFERKSAAHV